MTFGSGLRKNNEDTISLRSGPVCKLSPCEINNWLSPTSLSWDWRRSAFSLGVFFLKGSGSLAKLARVGLVLAGMFGAD